jgi:acyl-coenzyme A thioesterase PaaI-like protein
MPEKAIQDFYPEGWSHCYGCGSLNEHGHQIKSFWNDESKETHAVFHPKPYHSAIPGFVYGGLIASLVDCHGTGTAAAAVFHAEGRAMDTEPAVRFVTGSLHVDYLKPTPLGVPLHLGGRVIENKGRKVIVAVTVSANDVITARGQVVAVRVPDHWTESTPEK